MGESNGLCGNGILDVKTRLVFYHPSHQSIFFFYFTCWSPFPIPLYHSLQSSCALYVPSSSIQPTSPALYFPLTTMKNFTSILALAALCAGVVSARALPVDGSVDARAARVAYTGESSPWGQQNPLTPPGTELDTREFRVVDDAKAGAGAGKKAKVSLVE